MYLATFRSIGFMSDLPASMDIVFYAASATMSAMSESAPKLNVECSLGHLACHWERAQPPQVGELEMLQMDGALVSVSEGARVAVLKLHENRVQSACGLARAPSGSYLPFEVAKSYLDFNALVEGDFRCLATTATTAAAALRLARRPRRSQQGRRAKLRRSR